jgi:uncharacterized protein (TIGR02231 family)
MTMKLPHPVRALAALQLLLVVALRAAPEPVTSTITAVAVYADRAIVTRTAALDLTKGEHELVFENLPASLMDESLQVKADEAKGVARLTILDVNARTTFVPATPAPGVKALEDRLKELAQSRRKLDDRAAVLTQKRDYLLKIQTATTTVPNVERESASSRTSLDEWLKLIEFSEKTLTGIATEQAQLDIDRQKNEEELQATRDQLNQLRNGGGPVPLASGAVIRPDPRSRDRNVKTVTVRVSVSSPGTLSLALAYGVRGASWAPAYDAKMRGDAAQPSVNLTYFGTVRQSTGEDWKNVQLTLSTARPSLGGAAPELRAWVLDERPQPVMLATAAAAAPAARGGRGGGGGRAGGLGGAAPGGGASQSFARTSAELADGALAREVLAEFATASVDTGATSASFRIPDTATVLSDNAPQKVAIAVTELPAKLQYQSTPRVLESAFLSASVANRSDFPLLAGPMNTFLDDNFIATSALKTTMPEEKFDLSLGADEGISIKRKLVNRFTEKTGFSSSGNRVTYTIEVTVTNLKKAKQQVVFKELLPVSRNEKIEVKLLEPRESDIGTLEKPGKEVTREEDGKLVWRVDVEPGKEKARKFTLKFSVDYPADFQITGLE